MSFCYSLCSSSKGNATYIGDRQSGILIDAGLSCRQFTARMSAMSIDPQAVRAIFITHEHTDHVKGLFQIAKALNVPVYGSLPTLEALIQKDLIPPGAVLHEIRSQSAVCAGLCIKPFSIPHDATDPLGYRVSLPDGKVMCSCTDLGYVTQEVYENLCGSDFVLLESNYDPQMLRSGPYPYPLKRRIASDHGHLSNCDCANTVASLFAEGTTRFMLGHLSENNNRPEFAYHAALSVLSKAGAEIEEDFNLYIAGPQNRGGVIEL